MKNNISVMPATAKAAWTLRSDACAIKFKGSSLQVNHPIIAIVTLWLIIFSGFVCILEAPIRWTLF
jgi:hypothetical protein